uniref:Uncharacterized protein n=1 Tax=Rhizophora mucronata TaxID=61149 RepID=A0A2P2R1B3_RHIMU
MQQSYIGFLFLSFPSTLSLSRRFCFCRWFSLSSVSFCRRPLHQPL